MWLDNIKAFLGNFMFAGLPSSLHVIWDIMCGVLSFALFIPFFMKFLDRKITFVSTWGGDIGNLRCSYRYIHMVDS